MGFAGGSDGKKSACNEDLGSVSGWRRVPGEGNSPGFLPGESHGQRSLTGYIYIVHAGTEMDTTDSFLFSAEIQ